MGFLTHTMTVCHCVVPKQLKHTWLVKAFLLVRSLPKVWANAGLIVDPKLVKALKLLVKHVSNLTAA